MIITHDGLCRGEIKRLGDCGDWGYRSDRTRGEVEESLQGIVSGMMGEFPWYAGSAKLGVRYSLAGGSYGASFTSY